MRDVTLGQYSTIEAVLRDLVGDGSAPLRNWNVLGVQHIQKSLVPLIEALLAAGALPDAVTIAGKAYSRQPAAVEALTALGVRVAGSTRMTDPGLSYEEQLASEVRGLVTSIKASRNSHQRLLVLDEGAVALRALLTQDLGNVHVVEQTTRGARWAAGTLLPHPVVDVARSKAKQRLETPLIVDSMVRGLRQALETIKPAILRPHIGLIGYGTIGRALARRLSGAGYPVSVHERGRAAANAATADGFPLLELGPLLLKVEVLVGCTGSPVLTAEDLADADRGLILVNGASSDLEFALWPHRRPSAIVTTGPCDDPGQPWKHHYALPGRQRHVLTAGGFPINFYCDDEPIAAEDFQITRALMLAGVFQAIRLNRPGLHTLDPDLQSLVETKHRSRLTA